MCMVFTWQELFKHRIDIQHAYIMYKVVLRDLHPTGTIDVEVSNVLVNDTGYWSRTE
jgi:hypothetical protein